MHDAADKSPQNDLSDVPEELHSETAWFLASLSELGVRQYPDLQGFLEPARPLHVARAPGRLDVMGGIADYSGSLVLQMPIREATFAAIQPTHQDQIGVASLSSQQAGQARRVVLPGPKFRELAEQPYPAIQAELSRDAATAWSAYPLGVLFVLWRELGWQFRKGMRIVVQSAVPESKGVSSSAALEVAVMQAVSQMLNQPLAGPEMASLCQVAENRVVGAPCGIMDQMTSAVGRAGEMLKLRCQPAEVLGHIPLPQDISVWGIDSDIRHAVSGSDYTAVRTGAFMGYRMIADLVGFQCEAGGQAGGVKVEDSRWHGYLANLAPEEFQREFADRLPMEMNGQEFLDRFGGTTDSVTRVDPARTYAVRQPTAHPVYENWRVERFAERLDGPLNDRDLEQLGQLMYASHESYSACGIGSEGTDRIVALVRESGAASGLFGAKITGGGSGGTVAVLGRPAAAATVRQIITRYEQDTGRSAYLFQWSSPGACHFPKIGYRRDMF